MIYRAAVMLRMQNDETVTHSSLSTNQSGANVPRLKMTRVHIPFTFRLIEGNNNRSDGKCQIRCKNLFIPSHGFSLFATINPVIYFAHIYRGSHRLGRWKIWREKSSYFTIIQASTGLFDWFPLIHTMITTIDMRRASLVINI